MKGYGVKSDVLHTLKESDEEHRHADRPRASRREEKPVTVLLARHSYFG
jgi:hypothetical protein